MGDFYYCESCREVFGTDDVSIYVVENVHWWLDDKPVERLYFKRCPYCSGEYISEVPSCEGCGEYYLPEELDEDGLCSECRKAKEEAEAKKAPL